MGLNWCSICSASMDQGPDRPSSIHENEDKKDLRHVNIAKVEVIGICGPTCSGKTTLSSNLEKELKDRNINVEVVHGDDYHTDNGPDFDKHIQSILKELPEEFANRTKSTNHPLNVDYTRIMEEVSKYKTKLERSKQGGVVIVESFLLYYDEPVAKMCTRKIYIKPDDDKDSLLLRKWKRKYAEKCSLEEFKKYWDNCVWPQYLEFGTLEHMKVNRQNTIELTSNGNLPAKGSSGLAMNVEKVLEVLGVDPTVSNKLDGES